MHLQGKNLKGANILNSMEKDYTEIVAKIREAVKNPDSPLHHGAFNWLAYITDTFGPR